MKTKHLLNSFVKGELARLAEAVSPENSEGSSELSINIGITGVQATTELEPVDPVSLLSAEQRELACYSVGAMVEKYQKHKISEGDFSIVATRTETGDQQFTVLHSAGNGLFMGSWNDIFEPSSAENFMIEVGARQLDTRTGITLTTYKAMVEQARINGHSLPDSSKLHDENGQPWTATLRSGEQELAGQFGAPLLEVGIDGEVDAYLTKRDYSSEGIRFRPAVVLNSFD